MSKTQDIWQILWNRYRMNSMLVGIFDSMFLPRQIGKDSCCGRQNDCYVHTATEDRRLPTNGRSYHFPRHTFFRWGHSRQLRDQPIAHTIDSSWLKIGASNIKVRRFAYVEYSNGIPKVMRDGYAWDPACSVHRSDLKVTAWQLQ